MDDQFAYGMWIAVVFNTGLFLWFLLSYLPPRDDWNGAWSLALKNTGGEP